MGWCCRRYSIRKRGLEGEWRRQSSWFSGQPRLFDESETPFQPADASCPAARRGSPRRRYRDPGRSEFPRCADRAGRHASCGPDGKAPKSCATPVRHGRGPTAKQALQEYLERERLRGAGLDRRCQLKTLFQFAPGEVELPLLERHAQRPGPSRPRCRRRHDMIALRARLPPKSAGPGAAPRARQPRREPGPGTTHRGSRAPPAAPFRCRWAPAVPPR